MIELIAYAQTPQTATAAVGDSYVLDVSNPGAISLTYQVSKGEDVMGRYSPFSQTFRLPFSNINSEFFGHYYDINIDTQAVNNSEVPKYDIHRKAYCEIRMDGVPIIQGSLQLKKIYLQDEEYEVVVFGLEANLFQDIADLKLIDAFRDSSNNIVITYDVLMTDENIKTSFDLTQDVTEGTVGAGIVMFPIIDYGHTELYNFLHYQSDAQNLSGLAVANYLQPNQLKPSFNVKHLFEKIINQAGYSIDAASSPFLDTTAFTKLFMTLGSDRDSVATRAIHGVLTGKNDATTIATWTSAGTNPDDPATLLPLNQDSGVGLGTPPSPANFYDEGGYYDTTTYAFTAPNDGWFTGEFNARFDSTNCITDYGATVEVIIEGGYWGTGVYSTSGSVPLVGTSGGASMIDNVYRTWSGNLIQGQTVRVWVQASVDGTGGTLKLLSEGTYFIVQAAALINGYASIPYNMPDILQTDFIKDIVERFNLCVVSDPDNPMRLTIEPWQDYLDAGTHKDWTQKLDLSQSREITSTDTLKKQLVYYHDAEDSTNINTKQQDLLGHVIGEYKQEIAGDFIDGTLENKSIFAPFNVQNIPTIDNSAISDATDFLIAREYSPDTEGPVSDATPKLFYHNGLKTLGGGKSFFIGYTNSTYYPLCLPFYNAGQTMAVDSPMLLWQFAVVPSFYGPVFGTTPSNQGYFARYYQQFLLSIYSDEARLFECSIMLTPSDIFSFRFNDEIQIENVSYRVLKISNYQPFSGVPSKVQLLKKVEKVASLVLPDPNQECELNLTAYQANGNVLFTNPINGSTSSGTQLCCEENGLYWNGSDCIWNTGGGGGGGTKPTNGNPNLEWVQGKSYLTGVGGFNSIKKQGVNDTNPIMGEHSIRGLNVSSAAPSVNKDFVFYATSYSSLPVLATPDGNTSQSGSFSLAVGMMCRFVVRSLSIQTDSGTTSGSYGSTSFKVWTFVAKNIAGTITTSGSEQTDFAQNDGDVGTRTVNVSSAKGRAGFNPNDAFGVAITLTGTVDTVVAWHLDVSATFVDLSAHTAFNQDLILQENMGYIETENGNFLEQD
jgi:hypothetical protein